MNVKNVVTNVIVIGSVITLNGVDAKVVIVKVKSYLPTIL